MAVFDFIMLFRTKFVAAFGALAVVASVCAGLLILAAQRSETNQTRTTLAYASVAGYFEVYGAVFRTFKQARRDLISGSGEFAFDITAAKATILAALDDIETVSREEGLLEKSPQHNSIERVALIRNQVLTALDSIENASSLILTGNVEQGRQRAIEVLEGQVDSRIAALIEEGIESERAQLIEAQEKIQQFNQLTKTLAWLSVLVAVALSVLVLVTLVRRFSQGLKQLEQAANEYAADNLTHSIEIPGNDELSTVARNFGDMAQQILTKRQALEQVQQELEERVEERTQALSELNAELRERDRLRRQFFADVGHELRTPVTAIRGEAEVALRARGDCQKTQKSALERIVKIAEQMTEYTSDLFLIARGQAGVLDFRTIPLDLNMSVESASEQMRSLAAERNATINLALNQQPLVIEGDAKRLTQLAKILIGNALDHVQNDVIIEIETGTDGGFAALSIADSGPGIPAKDRSRIFDRYVRGTNNGETQSKGTGLGLAIAKSITQAHGGSINIDEGRLGGARITAKFPLTQTEPVQ